MIAKAEISNPIAVLVTPKEEAKIGIAGIIKPKPIATKKDTVERIATSLGISLNGLCLINLMPHPPWKFTEINNRCRARALNLLHLRSSSLLRFIL
jgi:hypothetical protein